MNVVRKGLPSFRRRDVWIFVLQTFRTNRSHELRDHLPSLKLTWPLKMDGWNMKFPFGAKRPIFRA